MLSRSRRLAQKEVGWEPEEAGEGTDLVRGQVQLFGLVTLLSGVIIGHCLGCLQVRIGLDGDRRELREQLQQPLQCVLAELDHFHRPLSYS